MNHDRSVDQKAEALRKRMAWEVGALVFLTPLFLYYAPRGVGVYVGMAVLFLCFIAVTAEHTRSRVWGTPVAAALERLWRSTRAMVMLTMPVVIAFFAWCMWTGHQVSYANLLLTFCFYLPWAFLQQTIFQFYLLGRLRVLLPLTSPILLAAANGTAYGLVHLPDHQLAFLTIIGGSLWSYSYLRDRHIWPLAISHALVGSTFYYFVSERDLYSEFLARFPNPIL